MSEKNAVVAGAGSDIGKGECFVSPSGVSTLSGWGATASSSTRPLKSKS